jgi:hypothetical protein
MIVAATTWTAEVSACSCLPITDVRDHARAVHTIFSGTATHRSNVPAVQDSPLVARLKRLFGIQPKYQFPQYSFDFNVDESLKGVRARAIRIYTPDSSAACGVGFEIGKKYLVFSHTVENRHQVSLCSATSPYEAISLDFLQLVREAVRGSSN